ncbi:MAG: hypothetical protein R3245_03475, partial [Kiloniellales bacterium]|nr:hypothetical protein [Kiloniellales bacterium]
ASGEEAVYYVESERATLSGNVEITRGENRLLGEFAEIDLAAGTSRLTGGTDASGKPKRVQGLILPRAVSKDTKKTGNGDGD